MCTFCTDFVHSTIFTPYCTSLDFAEKQSSQISKSATKVKGFSLKSEGNKKIINSSTLQACVSALQKQQEMKVKCPQFGLKINAKNKKIKAQKMTKQLTAQPVAKR